jgi:hypothetical protein
MGGRIIDVHTSGETQIHPKICEHPIWNQDLMAQVTMEETYKGKV